MAGASYVVAKARGGRVPLSTKVYQGIGALPEVFKGFGFGTFLLFFYSQVLGVSPVTVATAIAITTLLDAAVDPLIGSFSDNLKTRMGRRHPLMYASALPLAVGLYLVFSPPAGVAGNAAFAWVLGTTALVNVSISLFAVPWTALMTELSDDYAERTEIVIWRYVMGWTGGLAFTFSVWTFVFPSSAAFKLGQLNPAGYHLFAPILAIGAGVFVLLTTYLTRREVPFLAQPTETAAFSLRRFAGEIASMMSNRDFLVLFSGALLSACIGGTAGALGIYLTTYFWGLAPEQLRWFSLGFAGALVAFVTLPLMQRKFDKKTLMLGCFALLMVDGVVMICLRLTGVLPPNGSPTLFALLLSNQVLRVFMETILGVMFVSMLADSLDGQELRNGKRQEGMFAAALSFSTKATAGIGALAAGLFLQNVIHWPTKALPDQIDPATVFRLGVVAGVCVPMFYILPFVVGTFYRITRAQHGEIRRQVDARRAEGKAETGELAIAGGVAIAAVEQALGEAS